VKPKPDRVHGTVWKRRYRNGREVWAFKLDLGHTVDGKREQATGTGYATEGDAFAAMNQVRGDVLAGTYARPNLETVGDVLDHYLEVKAAQRKPSTVAGYRAYGRAHLKPALGKRRVQDLDVATLNWFYSRLGRSKDRPLSPRSRVQAHAILSGALDLAVKEGVIGFNPARRAEAPTTPAYKPPASTWSVAQLRRFLDTAQRTEPDWYPLFAWLAWTGTRRGEALGLTWGAVDLDSAVARIAATRIIVDNQVIAETPKTGSGVRPVYLSGAAVEMLRAWRRDQAAWWLEAGIRPNHELVFTDPRGEGIHPDRAGDAFRRITKRAGLPRIRVHDLRHLYVRVSVEAGIDAKIVSESAGHSQVSFTLTNYYAPSEKARRAAAEILGSAMAQNG
jgi:integrase